MFEKQLDCLIATSIDEVIDVLSLLYVWNFRGRKEEEGQAGYPFEKVDFFDLFYLVKTHEQNKKIPKHLLSFFLDYAESQERNIREIMFAEDVDLYSQAISNVVFAMEMFLLAKFYYKSEIDEEKLVEISDNYEDYESYIEDHFWGNIGCDMQASIMLYSS